MATTLYQANQALHEHAGLEAINDDEGIRNPPPRTRLAARRTTLRAALAAIAVGGVVAALLLSRDAASQVPPRVTAASPEAAGRYLAIVAGCNDCHTHRYIETNGAEPGETEWLKGSAVGFRGPWGTTYAPNLRLSVRALGETDWVATMRGRNGLPPMPWVNLAAMHEADLAAIYRYIRTLGEPGAPAPSALPPGVEPTTPVIDFVPVAPRQAAR